ncbi:MAG: DUF1549 domain-containing protein [Planctomycetaceae bacterium]|nr:DUF1549 domain-containing protein [Planctomycetales bacterium]MCB9925640.1 DUF1549 domain-containing protein [Planctomycetaceae bacterium]
MRYLSVAAAFAVGVAVYSCSFSARSADDGLAERLEASRKVILAAAARIDQLVEADRKKHNVEPSLPANDQIFMRRVYLDITGTIPTAQEAFNFLESKESNKRELLIDYLLASEGYASHYYNYWGDVLRIKSAGDNVELHSYVAWVKQSLKENKPYDKFVYELLTATGKPSENGAVGYYLRDQGMPLDNLSNTVSIFLGTQIGCAQCHDHPFERWTQKDFYEMAAFTYSVDTRASGKAYQTQRRAIEDEIKKRNLSAQQRQLITQMARYNQWDLEDNDNRPLKFPKDYDYGNAKADSVVTPKTIYGENPQLQSGQSRREAFAAWATSKDNPLFAKVIANRLWKNVMGVGLIEPLDDVEGAEASNPELMEFLTYAMVRLDFNMKQYLRMLMNTDVYQRRAVYREVSEEPFHFPGPTLRRMTAEQIWDSLVTLSMDEPLANTYDTNSPYRFPYFDIENASPSSIVDRGVALYSERQNRGKKSASMSASKKPSGPNLARASEMRQPAPAGHFLRDFGASDRELIEGSNQDPTVSQILTLINGSHHYQIVREGSQLMELLAKSDKDQKLRTRIIYLSILGREPSSVESRLALNVFAQLKQPYRGNRELIWILLNTPEFMFIQ